MLARLKIIVTISPIKDRRGMCIASWKSENFFKLLRFSPALIWFDSSSYTFLPKNNKHLKWYRHEMGRDVTA
jgi:hypothetical protein